MKHSTFSAQVANNLLTVLQGYTKGIRLVVVLTMLLIVGVGQAWGAEKTETISWNTYTTSGTGATLTITWTANTSCTITQAKGDNTSNNVSTSYATSPRWYQYHHITFTPKTGYTIKKVVLTGSGGSYNGQDMTFVAGSGTISKSGNATTITGAWTSSFKIKMGKQFRPGSVVVTYEEAAATVPVTGVSLNKSSLTLTEGDSETLTATVLPNNATDKTITWSTSNSSVATVSDGKVTAVAEGSATITVTTTDGGKTATCDVTVNPKPKYTVTWDVNGDQSVTTQVTEGSKPTFPATPSSCDATSNTFYGWATATWDGKINDVSAKTIYTSANEMPEVNGAVTYYAVFATKETSGSGTAGWNEVTSTSDLEAGATYAISNAATGGNYLSTYAGANNFPNSPTTICKLVLGGSADAWTFKINDASSYNNYYLTATSTTGSNYLKATSTIDDYCEFSISFANAGNAVITCTGKQSRNILRYNSTNNPPIFACYSSGQSAVYLQKYSTGSTTTYSDYITTCAAGDPCASLQAPNVTATATANSITLSWEAVDGATSYNVYNYTTDTGDETTELTYTFTGLSSETEYEWGVESAKDECYKETRGTITTPAAASPATITLSQLGVTSTIDTYSVGDQYTLPTTSSQSCDGKQLVGWSTVEVAETDTKPTENYYELGAEVILAATQTFYAVFAAGSGGGGEGWTAVTSTSDLEAGATYAISNAATEGTYLSTWNGGNNFPGSTSIICPLILGGSAGAWTFQIADGGTYNDRFLTAASTTSNNYLKAVTTADAYSVFSISFDAINKNAVITCTGKASRNILRYNANSGSPIFACYSSGQSPVYLQKYATGGGGYTAYSTSCIPTYSITYDFAGGTGSHCSNTSVTQGDPYTICDEAPTKEGHTFLGWWDGTIRRAAGETINPTGHVTLTAQWQIKTYTVIWSNNGATTPVGYNHGDTLEVPEEPEPCEGEKEFVGWTDDNTFTYHATDAPTPLFKTTTATVTADKTYYAVFATPPGTGGGGGGSETNTTLDFTAQGYANETAISNLTVDGVTATFAKGSNSNAPKYYTTGNAIRAYGGNTITLSANQITAATFTFGSSDGSNDIAADCGSWESPTWTGDATDEVVFTIGGTSGNRRITSIAVTYISGGGSGSYSDYTTICQQIESIEVQEPQTDFHLTDDFTIGEGKVMATLSDGITEVDVTSLATFSGYNMEVVGTYTVTVTYMGATATYNINVQPLDNAWVLTWNVSGKTNTGLGPRSVTKGSAIGTLPVPDSVPAACAGKTFMGWTESNIVPSDGVGIVYITPETKPDDNTTYYAVFATVNNFCTQKPIDQIASGSKVVIVAVASLTDDGGAGKAISSRATDDTYNLQGDDVAIYDQTINTPHSTCIWTITKSGEKYIFTQDGNYLNAISDNGHYNLRYSNTQDTWTITNVVGMVNTYRMQSTVTNYFAEFFKGKFTLYYEANDKGDFDMQFYVTANANGEADITDYTTGCAEYTITYYGFHGGYSTSCSSDGTIVLPVNSLHTVPDCGDVVTDHTNLGREFLNVWMTQPHGGHTFKPGDTFILTQDTTLYAQWKMETTSDVTTLPTDIEDLAGTDIYVYGGTTLNIQPGTTTINSLTLKGGLQADGSYKMPTVWVPEGATLVRNSNKIYLDLVVNAENWYPFAVPFETKNTSDIHYLHPDMRDAATYGQHFDIKTYDGARRADVGEDKANNWVRLKRHTTAEPVSFKPGIGYIISAMAYPGKDTATIRIPMSVPNTWFKNGEQAEVGTTVRNTIAVTAHAGAAADEHQRHAGWNFVANPYLTSFAGGNVANDGGLAYINGELIIEGSYEYGGDPVPYVTVPAYDFAYYSQHKLSDVKLSPEWSFFVQVGTGGTMNFTTAGRQQAPASIVARNAEERPVKMDVDLILSDNHSSDQTGIIICDRYTDAYEIGRDLEKLFGSAYNLSVYTLMEDNTPLAFQALAIRSSMQVIPVGYRAPEQGEYTFRLNEATSSIDLLNEQYEQLVLVDYQTGELTNLLYTDYTFYSERTQSNSRFAIYAVPRQNAPTDLPNAIGSDEEVRKVIYNDHLYILRDGNVYNGMGQKM